jgi:alcohol dehydrogenase
VPDRPPELGVLRAPPEVIFRPGAAEAVGELVRRHWARALLVTDPVIAAAPPGRIVLESLGAAGVQTVVFEGGVPEVPLEVVLEAIRAGARAAPECVIGLGGGSSIDLAKLVALGLAHGDELRRFYGEEQVPGPVAPLVAIPTTAGTGSEVTPVAVITDPDAVLKVGISSRALIPTLAVVDPTLTYGCPPTVTAFAGIDALAHAIEAFTAADRRLPPGSEAVFVGKNVLSDTLALEAIARIAPHLRGALQDDPGARNAVSFGSLCAGLAFGTAGTAVAHALQYPIGARTHTPHGLGTGLLLAYAMQFNLPVREAELAAVGRAMGTVAAQAGDDAAARQAIAAVAALAADAGLPSSLAEIGVRAPELDELAEQATGVTRLLDNNPRPAGAQELRGILDSAWRGELAPDQVSMTGG